VSFNSKAREFYKALQGGDQSAALMICEEMIELQPELSFYHFWKQRLSETRNDLASALSVPMLTDEINARFTDLDYSVRIEETSTLDPTEEKMRILKNLPFKGDIYLPTNKIPLDEQLKGLRRVEQYTREVNRQISAERFLALKNLIKKTGKNRVFVVGNGPSLKKTDLALLKDEITIGFNGIFLHNSFVPTIHIVEDHLVAEDRVEEIRKMQCPVKIYPAYLSYCLPEQSNTIFLNHLPRRSFPVDTDFSDCAEEVTYTGGTVTYTGLQVAASLGFKEIILIGVDASYKVENVERSTDYGTGVLESKADDINHFDPSYFGKGFRWHDPNVHTMLQAYRKVRNYAERTGKRVVNATIGGELEVFPRVNYWDLFDYKDVYPKTAIIDFTHIDWMCATGIVKKNMFAEWGKHSLLHVHAQNPKTVSAYQKVPNDCYAQGADDTGVWAALRALMEYDPDVLYLRPTHDRPALSILQLFMPVILNKPFVVHYMDDWLAKVDLLDDGEVGALYKEVMTYLFNKANRVLTISNKMASYLAQSFEVPWDKLLVVHNYTQSRGHGVLPKVSNNKVVRYFGNMEPDMSLETIHSVAKAVEEINKTTKVPVKFEIYTGQNYLDGCAQEFATYEHTRLLLQHSDYSTYLLLLESSDVNVLCYNFDEKSEVYLKYSMANKLPENISANVPFLAIGSESIGTITFLKEEGYPLLVTEAPEQNIPKILHHILFDKSAVSESHFERLREEFSEERNRVGFQTTLRQVAGEPANLLSQMDIQRLRLFCSQLMGELKGNTQLVESMGILEVIVRGDKEKIRHLVQEVRTHGLTWSLKSGLDRSKYSEEWESLAWLITSLDHDRFAKDADVVKRWLLKQ